ADEHALAVRHRTERRDEAGCPHAAEAAGGFNQQHFCAEPRRAHCRRGTSRTAARNQYVETFIDRDVALQLIGCHVESLLRLNPGVRRYLAIAVYSVFQDGYEFCRRRG